METALQIASIGTFVLLAVITVLFVLLIRRTLKFHDVLRSNIAAGFDQQAKTQNDVGMRTEDGLKKNAEATEKTMREVKALTASVEKLRVSLEESVKF
jgi:hypothetical protein